MIIRAKGSYARNWKKLATFIKAQAEFCCENCLHPHDPPNGYTLTVHHLDGNKAIDGRLNLLACCQRCHLVLQANYLPGQLPLLPPPFWMELRMRKLLAEKYEAIGVYTTSGGKM